MTINKSEWRMYLYVWMLAHLKIVTEAQKWRIRRGDRAIKHPDSHTGSTYCPME